MKVLVTGITKQQIGEGNQLGYEPVVELFANGLRLGGVEIEHRRTVIGEDLTGYDAVMVGLIPFFSVASSYLYHALDVIERAWQDDVPMIWYVDDWAFTTMMNQLGTHVRMDTQLVREFFRFRRGYDWAESRKPELQRVVERIYQDDWPPTLVPAFSWGNHDVLASRLPRANDVHFVDVSALAREYPTVRTDERRREWVLGTVSNQLKWLEKLNLSWPVSHFGNKTSRAPEKIQEADLVQRYAEARGVLSPRYPSVLGTGWWRNRVVYAARNDAILLCDPKEMPQLGDAYQLKPADVERMSDRELDDLAAAQRSSFFAHQPSQQAVVDQLMSVLNQVTSR